MSEIIFAPDQYPQLYEDLALPLSSAKVPAVNDPSWEAFVGNLSGYAYSVNDYQEFDSELLHGYIEGSTFEFHIHGALNATVGGTDERVKFEIEYSIANPDPVTGFGDVYPSTTTISAELVVPATTADLTSVFMVIGSDATGSFGIGAQIAGRIRRIAASSNELTAPMFVRMLGIHYHIDSLGSRTMYVK